MKSGIRKGSVVVVTWVLATTMAYAQAPNLSIQTPLSGLMGSTFQAFVSLSNNGTATAANVTVTSITLDAAALTSPALPLSVEPLSPGNHNVLDLRFDGTNLIVGNA